MPNSINLVIWKRNGISVEIVPQDLEIRYRNEHTGVIKHYEIIVTGNGISFRKTT